MITIPKTLNPTPAFEIIDSNNGYAIYTDTIRHKDEADPASQFVFKKLSNGNYAHASLHCAAWEGEMECERYGMHKIPAIVQNWLSQQV